MKIILLFLVAMASIFSLDMHWLGVIAKKIYAQHIGLLLRKSGEGMDPVWWSAGIVYICMALGIIFFVLPGAQGSYLHAFGGGLILGIVIYGTYDFTNYAILENWPLKITLIDFVWGMVLCSLSSLTTALV